MEKIKKLRNLFIKSNLDGYFVPKNDEYFNEYVPEEKDSLKYISNFSGSFGYALILKKKNYLFVDGRYTQQANKQSGNNFKIITLPTKFSPSILKKKLRIGFNPRLFTELTLSKFFKDTNCILSPVNKDLVNQIKKNKKNNIIKKFFLLKTKNVGENCKKKIKKISKILIKSKLDLLFVTASENIAWLLNMRGKDINFSPIPNSFLIINKNEKVYLFCNLKKIDKLMRKNLKNIDILSINCIEEFLHKIKNKKIQVDAFTCSILFKNVLNRNNKIIEKYDPIYLFKSVKNKIEIKNTINAHIEDGIALTKFLIWLKNIFGKKKITEISAQKKLLSFRKKNKNFKSLSFPTISASGPNGSIIHYKAEKKTNRVLQKDELFLVDSGGQYNYGTTDVTRTISLGNKNKRIKNIFTLVLKGHIAVASFKIKKNTVGSDVDIVARKYLKKANLDYAHGTGHGVGCYLNVHEGPLGISKNNNIRFLEGMIVSNEPGYYEKGKFGIRIENLVRVKKDNNDLKFQNLTLAPIDKLLIEKKLLNKKEINWLNDYHRSVFKVLSKYMNKVEFSELRKLCSNI